MSIKLSFKYLLLLLTALPAINAIAADDKIYPASECVVWSGPNVNYSYSSIFNNTNRVIRVDCPAIHDVIGRNIRSATFTAKDRHTLQGVACSLNSVYARNVGANGQVWGWFGATISTGGSPNTWQTLGLGGAGANTSTHYYLSCSLPPVQGGRRSSLFSYRVNER